MMRYALARIIGLFPTLLLLVTAAFFVIRLAPGGPFDEERALPPQVRANLEAAYGLDAPLATQYLRYVGGLLRADLGPSFKHKDMGVNELIAGACMADASWPIGPDCSVAPYMKGAIYGPQWTCAPCSRAC